MANAKDRQDDAQLVEFERMVRAEIEAHGFHVVLVQGGDHGPAYGFTIGLWSTYEHPEVVVFGLDAGQQEGKLHQMLDLIGERVGEGQRLQAGEPARGLVDGFECAVRRVEPKRISEYLDFANRIHGDDQLEFLQVVWPDPSGRYPWDASFSADLKALQPVLSSNGR